MRKITRIAFNSDGWRRPTGEAAEIEGGQTYTVLNGFGHEDWLFRNEWIIDGWRYAFLQGVGKSHPKLVRDGKPFDVTLFTIQPDKRRRFVAHILDIECLSDMQAEAVHEAYVRRGWLQVMESEIRAIGGNERALGDARWAKHIFNVRFRLENVNYFSPDSFALPDDPIILRSRYILRDALPDDMLPPAHGRNGKTTMPNISGHVRAGTSPIEVTPEHAIMQMRLMALLQKQFPDRRIVREADFVDVVMETDAELRLYEIKSDLSPRRVLRQAIGQLLEYAFFGLDGRALTKKTTLIVVGRNPLSKDDEGYLAFLRQQYQLPIEYLVMPLQ